MRKSRCAPYTLYAMCRPFRVAWLGILLLLFIGLAPSANAQNYVFSVPELKMQVYVQPNASARIVYDITFENEGPTIIVVDIGTPHEGYNISNMKASIDGADLPDIRPSEYVKPGVEIHLSSHSIARDQRGTLHFEFTMPDLVYQDTTRSDYASLKITPTWFDSQLVNGVSDLWIAIHMLPGIQPEEMLYQDQPFTDKAIYEGHASAVWHWQNIRPVGPHLVGVSFPQRGMERVVRTSLFELAYKWFTGTPGVRFWAGIIFSVLFGFLFFRFSGGTGISVFALLLAVLIGLFVLNPVAHMLSFLPLLALIALNEGYWMRRRRSHYLPAIAQVEGGGIKRGLTAPEAAVLLEMPLNKVLTLVIFGLLKKGILRQVQATPLVVEMADEFRAPPGESDPDAINKRRRKAAQEKGVVLHKYEEPFLEEVRQKPGVPVAKIDLSRPMKELIRSVAKRVKGFDLSDTQDYYRQIIRRALREAQAIPEISEREKVLDRDFEWILLDGGYPTVLETPDCPYQPVWTRPISAGSGPAAPPPAAPSPAAPQAPGPGGQPSFGDVAASFAGWAENTMGNMATAIGPVTLQPAGAHGGVIDLSGADKVTSNIFEALAKSSESDGGGLGGGGGGSCACACAGCACACACAGGGR